VRAVLAADQVQAVAHEADDAGLAPRPEARRSRRPPASP
jgi:hypothetical protein